MNIFAHSRFCFIAVNIANHTKHVQRNFRPYGPTPLFITPVKGSHSQSQMILRLTYPYQLPLSKATCCGHDFVPYFISNKF